MPIIMHVEPEKRRVRGEIVGDFSMTEIFDAIDGAVDDPAFQRGFNVLTDHSDVGSPLTTFQAEQLVAHIDSRRESLGGVRWAAVVRKPASRGMLRMVGALAESIPVRVRVFDSLSEAEAWLESPDQ